MIFIAEIRVKRPSSSNGPFEIFNIENSKRVKLMHYIKLVEKNLNKKAKIKFLPIQPGDIKNTLSSNTKLNKYINYKPKISAEVGVKKFIDWYKDYYKKN